MTPTRRLLQRTLPVVVTAVSLGWVGTRFDMGAVAAALTPRVFWVLLPALFLYGCATLVLESSSILCLLNRRPERFDAWTAARIKSASYLLAIVNYALGGAALTVLLARRAELGMGKAAGVVILISFTDLAVVLTLGAAGLLGQSSALALHGGLVALAAAAGLSSFALLRFPGSLGPLERLRSFAVFDALRDASFGQRHQCGDGQREVREDDDLRQRRGQREDGLVHDVAPAGAGWPPPSAASTAIVTCFTEGQSSPARSRQIVQSSGTPAPGSSAGRTAWRMPSWLM